MYGSYRCKELSVILLKFRSHALWLWRLEKISNKVFALVRTHTFVCFVICSHYTYHELYTFTAGIDGFNFQTLTIAFRSELYVHLAGEPCCSCLLAMYKPTRNYPQTNLKWSLCIFVWSLISLIPLLLLQTFTFRLNLLFFVHMYINDDFCCEYAFFLYTINTL